MNTIFVKNTGVSFKQYNISKLLPPSGGSAPFSHVVAFAVKNFNSSGVPIRNSSYTYVGVESGKYPYALKDANEKEFWFNDPIDISSNYLGLFANIGPGDGLYVIAD